MTTDIELAKKHGITYYLTPENTTEMHGTDRQIQAFADAVRLAERKDVERFLKPGESVEECLMRNRQDILSPLCLPVSPSWLLQNHRLTLDRHVRNSQKLPQIVVATAQNLHSQTALWPGNEAYHGFSVDGQQLG